MNKILLVGCGHMGNALLKAWIKNSSYNISVIDPNKYKYLKQKYSNKILIFKSFETVKKIEEFDIIVFAIKPHITKKVVPLFDFLQNKRILFISIVAGKRINFFEKALYHPHQIIRAMPNMPALVQKGITCFVANKITNKKNRKIANELFSKVGKTIWLKKESDIDKVTAISGSGPAYYFLFIENLILEAIKLGIKSNIAKELVYQTALGSIELLFKDKKSAQELKNIIAVKGGTTEAAIHVFEKNSKFKKIIGKAINAAYYHSIKLGKN